MLAARGVLFLAATQYMMSFTVVSGYRMALVGQPDLVFSCKYPTSAPIGLGEQGRQMRTVSAFSCRLSLKG